MGLIPHICSWCKKPFEARRPGQKYCPAEPGQRYSKCAHMAGQHYRNIGRSARLLLLNLNESLKT